MNEFIKEAEKLYEKIDKVQVHLINARLNNDEEGKKSAIREMETAMCNTMQLLKCFIEHKDNLVDLWEVWHDIVEEPVQHLTVAYATKNNKLGTLSRVTNNRWTWYIDKYGIIKWAYVEDLLPKGGE